jgi:hypothetical protein
MVFSGLFGHIGVFILGGYFGHFILGSSSIILVIMVFSGLFWSFWSFRGCFYHFRGSVCILVILGVLSVFWGLF